MNLKIRQQLLELKGYKVVLAMDHQSALEAATDVKVDLAIIDYHLAKGESGEYVAQDLRVMFPDLPLIMLSGDPNIPESARDCVDSVFIKGVSEPGDLLKIVRELLGKRA